MGAPKINFIFAEYNFELSKGGKMF